MQFSAGRRRPRRSIWRSSRPMWCPRPICSRSGPEGFKRQADRRRALIAWWSISGGSRITLEAFRQNTGAGVPLIKQVIFENRRPKLRRGFGTGSKSGRPPALLPNCRCAKCSALPRSPDWSPRSIPSPRSICFGLPNYVPPMDNDHVPARRCIFRSIRGLYRKRSTRA